MTTAYWRRKERLYSFVDSNWDLKAVVLIQVSYDQYTELQRYKNTEHGYKAAKSHRKPFSTLFEIL